MTEAVRGQLTACTRGSKKTKTNNGEENDGGPVETALIKAISAIHRSDSLDGFEQAFLGNVSAAIEADAFGIYLLDAKRKAPEKIVAGASRVFIEEYESYRRSTRSTTLSCASAVSRTAQACSVRATGAATRCASGCGTGVCSIRCRAP